jgi:hypothetical protein
MIIPIGQTQMIIDSGVAEIELPEDATTKERIVSLRQHLRGAFHAQLLYRQTEYKIFDNYVTLYPDGRKAVTVFGHNKTRLQPSAGMRAGSATHPPDEHFAIINAAASWFETNGLLRAVLGSLAKATSDPGNALVHLYEIRDALEKHFGGARDTTLQLGVSSSRWSRFGQIANDLPIKEGRHRRKHAGALRGMTNEEHTFATSFAKDLIGGYLKLLSRQKPAG